MESVKTRILDTSAGHARRRWGSLQPLSRLEMGAPRKGEMDQNFKVRNIAEKPDYGPSRITASPPIQVFAFFQTPLEFCLSSSVSPKIRV